MRASHDTMLIHVDCRVEPPMERTVVVRTGSTVQQLLGRLESVDVMNADVSVNGRSVSRLTPLLPGDSVVIAVGC